MTRAGPALLAFAILSGSCSNQPTAKSSQQPVTNAAAQVKAPAPPAEASPPIAAVPSLETPGSLRELGLDGGDLSADPCSDFYQYACGGAATTAAANRKTAQAGRWTSPTAASSSVMVELQTWLGKDTSAAGAMYKACLETVVDTRTAAALGPAQPLFAAIENVSNPSTLMSALALLHRNRVWAAFSIIAAPDFADGRRAVLHIDRAGLGLGDRDNYLEAKDDTDSGENLTKARRDYVARIAEAFRRSGASKTAARARANRVMRVETALARASRSRYERRIPAMLNFPVDRAGLRKIAPRLDWDGYFEALGAPTLKAFNVTSKHYLEAVNSLSRSLPARTWQAYLAWQVHRTLTAAALRQNPPSSKAADVANRNALHAPCARIVADVLPDLVAAHMASANKGARAKAEQRFRDLTMSLSARVSKASWMQPTTRKRAVAKLQGIKYVPAAAPWNQPELGPYADSLVSGLLAARRRMTDHQLALVTSGAEAHLGHSPVVPGVYYDWLGNRIIVVQPSLLGDQLPLAASLGVSAALAGHELSHAVDDEGARWNPRGGLHDWWTPADNKSFKASARCLVAQLDGATGAPAAGDDLLLEYRADIVGLDAGFQALQSARTSGAASPGIETIRGTSDERLFFLAAASALCSQSTSARFRVNSAVSNLPDFARVFDCKTGSAMVKTPACSMW